MTEEVIAADQEFCEAVWSALKGDHNDLRRQQIILKAHRDAIARLAHLPTDLSEERAREVLVLALAEIAKMGPETASIWAAEKARTALGDTQ